MSGRFDGRVALITGAAAGMGQAITRRMVEEGASVLAVDIDEGGLAETAKMSGETVEVHPADVSHPSNCALAVAYCIERFGRLDVLGNVAGIYRANHVTDVTVEEYRLVMGVNLDAYFFLAQAAIPYLLDDGGSIINIASNAGLQGVPYSAVYCMSKGGVVQLTRALATEFLKTPLRVNAIAPAGTNTNLLSTVHFPPDIDPDLASRMAGHRGMAESEEIAALFAFLVSDEARSVTGAIYTVDNGLTAS